MSRKVSNARFGLLYIASAGLLWLSLIGHYMFPILFSLLAVAFAIVIALSGGHWSRNRRERVRLERKHGLSSYDAHMAMHLVGSGQVMREALRSAGRDYAQRQLKVPRSQVWVPIVGMAMAVAAYIRYAALPGAQILGFAGIGTVGYYCYRTYTRRDRLRKVLDDLSGATQSPESPTQRDVIVVPHRSAQLDQSTPSVPTLAASTASSTEIESGRVASTSQVTLQRSFTWRNSLAEYIVEIDGKRVGRLRPRASLVHELRPGKHHIRVHFDTTGYPKKGYMGSPTFEISLEDGESEVLDVIPVSSVDLQLMRDIHEGWLMLVPAADESAAPRIRHTITWGAVLRYVLTGVVAAALLANWFVFPTGSTAWSISDVVILIGAGTLIYFRFFKK